MANLTQVLDAIDNALGVLKTIADTPGVSMIPYVGTVSGAIGALRTAYSVGKNITPYVTAIADTFKGDGSIPTQAQLDALDAKIAELEAKVDAPLPPAEPGEPE